jgi:hypothetical protein
MAQFSFSNMAKATGVNENVPTTVPVAKFLNEITRKPETTVFYPALSLFAVVPPVPCLRLHLYQLRNREAGTH